MSFKVRLTCIILVVWFCNSAFSQVQPKPSITSAYKNYFKSPREQAFIHLNKHVFLPGEAIGFSAYVLNALKKPNVSATNLFCTITDSTGTILKQKLMLLQNGFAHNIFEVDDGLKPGNYVFNAYTNWMLNFNQRFWFSEPIKVIGETNPNTSNTKAKINIQVLPEGGHLLQNLKNTLGIIVENQNGKSLGITSGYILNQNNDTTATFSLNKFGIGKTFLRPLEGENYTVNVKYGNTLISKTIPNASATGVMLTVNKVFESYKIKVATNNNTLPNIRSKNFTIALHNTKQIKTWEFSFEKGPKLELYLKPEDLLPGINIITVFNNKNQPVLERLLFNYNGITLLKGLEPEVTLKNDTASFKFKIPKADGGQLHHISVSVLHKNTKAINTTYNLLSSVYLKPFVKGHIQTPNYYFTKINKTTQQNLDNLLLTQGWSSYNWGDIFNTNIKVTQFEYQQGITFKGEFNATENESYMIQPLTYTKAFIFNTEKNNYFEAKPLFPLEGEELRISKISASGELSKPIIIPSFYPNHVPKISVLKKTIQNTNAVLNNYEKLISLNDVQELETVTLNAKVERTRYEKLKQSYRGSLDIFNDEKRVAYTDFATYIASKGFIVNQTADRTSSKGEKQAFLQIYNPTRNNLREAYSSPLIILNGMVLTDLSILSFFDMDTVDYIEIDKQGASMGMRGANGVIRIVTDPSVLLKQKTFKAVQNYKFPLSFSTQKQYYQPKYQYYNTPFYKSYGAVAWFPNEKLDRTGSINLKFKTHNNKNFVLYINGIINDKYLFSETHNFSLN